jgi:hypothetical protein
MSAASDAAILEAGPLTRERIAAAARAAGFRVSAVSADIPAAIRPRFPFAAADYNDPLLARLRTEYRLDQVVEAAKDEWTRQLLLKDWVFRQIPGGDPKTHPKNAIDILKLAAQGERFYCTYYAITYSQCAQALGWQARKIAVDRRHGPEGMGSTHHGAVEIWSNQFRKWVVIDAQSNLHFEKKGAPLSAWEIREGWLQDKGAGVDHVVGAPPKAVKKNPAMVWPVPDDDEIATYFWLAIDDAVPDGGVLKRIFPQDQWNAGEVWYQNDDATGRGRIHIGYTKNLFIPTARIEDAYWTVGVVEAAVLEAAPGVIRMKLDSYCPNRVAHQVSVDGVSWVDAGAGNVLDWKLAPGWNTLRLRTMGKGGVTGPETAVVLHLITARP